MQNDFQAEYVAKSVAKVKELLFEEFLAVNKARFNKISEESPELKGDLLTYERITAHDNGWNTYLPKLLNREAIEDKLRDEIEEDVELPTNRAISPGFTLKSHKTISQSKETFRILGTKEVIVFEEWPESYDFVYKETHIVLVRDKRNPERQILVLRNTQRNVKGSKNNWGTNEFWKIKVFKNGFVRFYTKRGCCWLSLKNWPTLNNFTRNKEVQRILMTMNSQHEYIRNMVDKFPIERYVIPNKDYRKLTSPIAFYERYACKSLLKFPITIVTAQQIVCEIMEKDIREKFLSSIKDNAWPRGNTYYSNIYYIYFNNLENRPDNLSAYDVTDASRLASNLGEPFNWFIKSGKKFKEYHDDLARRLRLKEIELENKPLTPDMKFDVLKSDENYTVEFITTKLRLFEESDIQKHCVSSYWRKINDGNCGIYSIVDKEGKRWTVELQDAMHFHVVQAVPVEKRNDPKYKKVVLISKQCRGKFNEQAPKELNEWIKKQLKDVAET